MLRLRPSRRVLVAGLDIAEKVREAALSAATRGQRPIGVELDISRTNPDRAQRIFRAALWGLLGREAVELGIFNNDGRRLNHV